MPAGGAAGKRRRAFGGLQVSVAVGGTDLEPAGAGLGCEGRAPLPPYVGADLFGEFGVLPGTSVHPDLDGADAAVLGPLSYPNE